MERKTFWLVSTDMRVGKTAFVLHHLSESNIHTIHYKIIYIMYIYMSHTYIHIHVSLFLNIHTRKWKLNIACLPSLGLTLIL